MKRFLNLVLVILLITTLLVGCGASLKGEYIDNNNRTLVFTSSDKITFEGLEGTYSISDDRITFIIKGNVQEYSFSKVGDSLVIDGVEYKRK